MVEEPVCCARAGEPTATIKTQIERSSLRIFTSQNVNSCRVAQRLSREAIYGYNSYRTVESDREIGFVDNAPAIAASEAAANQSPL